MLIYEIEIVIGWYLLVIARSSNYLRVKVTCIREEEVKKLRNHTIEQIMFRYTETVKNSYRSR